MPLNNKSNFWLKIMVIGFTLAFIFPSGSFGRNGIKLYSIGNNSPWASAGSWALSANGASAGLTPQGNDTLVILTSVIQNVNFMFSENGCLEISNTGLLRGDNLSLTFSGNSSMICNGVVKIKDLLFTDNTTFSLNQEGKVTVFNSYINQSSSVHFVTGSLAVSGLINLYTGAIILGNGSIEATNYEGNGSAFGINPVSVIPQGSLISEFNWVGSYDNNWAEPLNWAGGQVPTTESNVAILTSVHNPHITGKSDCGNLFINNDANFTVTAGADFQISGDLSIKENGKLLLKNSTTEKSSLIISNTVTGKVQAECPVVAGQHVLVSSPVVDALSGVFINMYLRPYNENSSQWGEYIVPTDQPLSVMQGYELFSLYNETRIFEGTPVNESKTFSISNTGDGLNLSGNPFTSYIDWEDNKDGAWQRTSIASAIYYPDPSGSGNYAVYMPGGEDAVSINNGSRYIPPMQGFFVKAAKQGILSVNKKSCVRNLTDAKSAVKNNSVKFKLRDSEGLSDEAMFRVVDNSTFGFDDNLDALKLKGVLNAPILDFGTGNDIRYAINTIPSVNSSLDIPMNIECSKSGMFSISVAGSTNFEYRYPVILEDKKQGLFIDLRADSVYSFYHSPEMNSDRFEIHFYSPEAIDQKENLLTEVSVYPGEIRVTGSDSEFYTAKLYSTEGKLISAADGTLSEGIVLSTGSNISSGICILQIFNGKTNLTKKIYLSK